MLSNERVILRSLLTPDTALKKEIQVNHIEGLDNEIIANTADKRRKRALAIGVLCQSSLSKKLMVLEGAEKVVEMAGTIQDKVDEEFGKEMSHLIKKLTIMFLDFADDCLIDGYLIGKFAQNNEYLDPVCAKFRSEEQTMETKDPDLFERRKKERDFFVEKTLQRHAKDMGISIDEAREHFERYQKV